MLKIALRFEFIKTLTYCSSYQLLRLQLYGQIFINQTNHHIYRLELVKKITNLNDNIFLADNIISMQFILDSRLYQLP